MSSKCQPPANGVRGGLAEAVRPAVPDTPGAPSGPSRRTKLPRRARSDHTPRRPVQIGRLPPWHVSPPARNHLANIAGGSPASLHLTRRARQMLPRQLPSSIERRPTALDAADRARIFNSFEFAALGELLQEVGARYVE